MVADRGSPRPLRALPDGARTAIGDGSDGGDGPDSDDLDVAAGTAGRTDARPNCPAGARDPEVS